MLRLVRNTNLGSGFAGKKVFLATKTQRLEEKSIENQIFMTQPTGRQVRDFVANVEMLRLVRNTNLGFGFVGSYSSRYFKSSRVNAFKKLSSVVTRSSASFFFFCCKLMILSSTVPLQIMR